MAWSNITAGGSATTWSSQTASAGTWSGVTAGGSSTTWSAATVGGSATTWLGTYSVASVRSYLWIPYGTIIDQWGGVDFEPKATNHTPWSLDSTRPVVVWLDSTVTSSNFTAERYP